MVLLLAACGSDVGADASGAEIYASVCARCHGLMLEGGSGPGLGVDSPSASQPESYFVQTVARGFGRMPSFGGTLNDDQIQRVVAFILEQQGR
jgi:mono/diheme cytochrome c family protein